MKKLPVLMLCAACAIPALAAAHDHDNRGPPQHAYRGWQAPPPRGDRHAHYVPAPAYRYYGAYPQPVRYAYPQPVRYAYPYRYTYPYPYPYARYKHHDNDDALWAIGGLAVGILIGTAIDDASAPRP